MFNFSRDQTVGHNGERWAFDQLEKAGYKPRFDPDFQRAGFDLKVMGLPVEVKFAHKTYKRRVNAGGFTVEYPRWQWHIHPTSYDQGDWVLILVAQDDKGDNYAFVLPGSALNNRTHVAITSHPKQYRGWLKQWLDRWDVIGYLAQGSYQNGGPLFTQWAEAA